MTDDEISIALATIVVLGVGAQWVGRRLRIPSLLLLLPAGLIAGDVLDLVEPEVLFGDLLFPGVTLLLSLLLFQSALQLRLEDLPRSTRGAVARLVSVGLLVTFVGACTAVGLALDVPVELAILTGAILTVSGPTVVGPLLDIVRPRDPTGSILRWEGTTLDPLGATLAVVTLNVILASRVNEAEPLLEVVARLGLGVAVGFVAAGLLVFVISRFLLTDDMEASVALLFAALAFTVAEVVLSEAGLFATVTMGVAAANQRIVTTARIRGFGETLEVLIIGGLFITLGALVELDAMVDHAVAIAVITAALVVVVRPVAAALSLVGSPLPARDRALIGWMDPRGIVAAATAAQFTQSLTDAGYDAGFLLPVVFGVILGTGVTYGLTAAPVARLLGVVEPAPRGVGLLGDDPWLAPLGHHLAAAGVPTLLMTDLLPPAEVAAPPPGAAPFEVVSLHEGHEQVEQAAREAGLARVIVSAPRASVVTLFESELIEVMGRRHILRVPHERTDASSILSASRWAPPPFGPDVSREELIRLVEGGARVERVASPPPAGTLLLAAVAPSGAANLRPMAVPPGSHDVLIGLCP